MKVSVLFHAPLVLLVTLYQDNVNLAIIIVPLAQMLPLTIVLNVLLISSNKKILVSAIVLKISTN